MACAHWIWPAPNGSPCTCPSDWKPSRRCLVRRAPEDTLLGVFNFGDGPANVTLDLGQTTLGNATYSVTDALSGAALPDLSGATYTAQLPAAGSLLLRLKAK